MEDFQTVKLKDGTTVKFPKNPTEEDWKTLEELESTSVEQGAGDKALDWLKANTPDPVKNVGSSVVKGALALPAMAQDGLTALMPAKVKKAFRDGEVQHLERLVQRKPDPLMNLLGFGGTETKNKLAQQQELEILQKGGELPGTFQRLSAGLYQPKTTGEKYVDQGVQGAVTGGRNYIIGALAGLGGEAGGQMSKTEANPEGSAIARIVGSLATGGGASLLHTLGGTKADLAKKLVETLTSGDAAKSTKAMQAGLTEGLPLTLHNSLPDNEDLASMARYLASHETGKEVKRTLKNQASNVRGGTAERVADLPGQVSSNLVTANTLKAQVSDAYAALKQERASLVDPLYAQAGNLGQATTRNITAKIDDLLKAPGLDIDAAGKLKMLKEELLTSSVNGSPRTHALDIKAAIDDLANNSALRGQNPLAPKTTGALKNAKKELFAELELNAANLGDDSLAEANKAYAKFTKEKINPFRESISGKILGPQGSVEGVNAAEGVSKSLFKWENPEAIGSNILTLQKDLQKVHPTALTDAFKTHLDDTVKRIPESANPATYLRDKLWNSTGNRTATERGLKAMEEAQGLPEGALGKGFKRWLDLVDKVAKSEVSVVGKTSGELAETGGANSLSKVLSFATIAPLAGPRDAVSKLYLNSALRDIDKLFVEPEGLQMLIELSKKATSDKIAKGMIATMLNTSREGAKAQEEYEAVVRAKKEAAALAGDQ